jgi:hypothetical protein
VAATAVWARVGVVASSGAEVLTIVVTGAGAPGLAAVDALARWQLWARRAGGRIQLREASKELARLLDLVGLLGEVGWEPEGGEELLCVEERVDCGDLFP